MKYIFTLLVLALLGLVSAAPTPDDSGKDAQNGFQSAYGQESGQWGMHTSPGGDNGFHQDP
jgi:hypothetical protein